MVLLIDVGNQQLKMWVMENENCCQKAIIATTDYAVVIEKIRELLIEFSEIEFVLISSVVTELEHMIKLVCQEYCQKVIFFENELYQEFLDFKHLPVKSWQSKGSDRIVASVGAVEMFGQNVAVFDLGTALTLDIVIAGKYHSGLIFPGINLLGLALKQNTSKLKDYNYLQTDIRQTELYASGYIETVEQIELGILIGVVGQLKAYLNYCQVQFDQANITEYQLVFTGGDIKRLIEILGLKQLRELLGVDQLQIEDLMVIGLKTIAKKLYERELE